MVSTVSQNLLANVATDLAQYTSTGLWFNWFSFSLFVSELIENQKCVNQYMIELIHLLNFFWLNEFPKQVLTDCLNLFDWSLGCDVIDWL